MSYNPQNPNGQATSANSAPVVIASDQSNVNVTESSGHLSAMRTDIDYRYSGGKTSYAAVINTSGNHVVITPASGKKIRVFWVSFIPNPDNSASNLVTVKFTAGVTMYVGYAMAHWEYFEGATNDTVTVNTATADSVAVTIHYQEV